MRRPASIGSPPNRIRTANGLQNAKRVPRNAARPEGCREPKISNDRLRNRQRPTAARVRRRLSQRRSGGMAECDRGFLVRGRRGEGPHGPYCGHGTRDNPLGRVGSTANLAGATLKTPRLTLDAYSQPVQPRPPGGRFAAVTHVGVGRAQAWRSPPHPDVRFRRIVSPPPRETPGSNPAAALSAAPPPRPPSRLRPAPRAPESRGGGPCPCTTRRSPGRPRTPG